MCVGALVHARIGTLVFGATEPRTGAVDFNGPRRRAARAQPPLRGRRRRARSREPRADSGVLQSDADEPLTYSCRSARIGSMRLARCAGISPAAADTSVSSSTVARRDPRIAAPGCRRAATTRSGRAPCAGGNADREADREQQQHLAHHQPDDDRRAARRAPGGCPAPSCAARRRTPSRRRGRSTPAASRAGRSRPTASRSADRSAASRRAALRRVFIA